MGNEFVGDFFLFRKMVTPIILKILYALGAISIFIGSIVLFTETGRLGLFLAMLIVGELIWRVVCEGIILLFSIHEALSDSRDYLKSLAERGTNAGTQKSSVTALKSCVSCGKTFSHYLTGCPHCGARAEEKSTWTCPKCGEDIKGGFFCPVCGVKKQ